MFEDMLLREYGTSFWFQANRQQRRISLYNALLKLLRVLGHGDGMQIYNGIKHVVVGSGFILELDPLPQCAEIVPQMRGSRRLDPRKYRFPFCHTSNCIRPAVRLFHSCALDIARRAHTSLFWIPRAGGGIG